MSRKILIIVCLLSAFLTWWIIRKRPSDSPPSKINPSKPDPRIPPKSPDPKTSAFVPSPSGQLRLSDDVESKKGDFWLEQIVEFSSAMPSQSDSVLLNLYLAVDPA